MGERDIDSLTPIFQHVTKLCHDNGWPFNFIMDTGHHENAFQVFNNGMIIRPPVQLEDRSTNIIMEPDFLDWRYKLVIEYNEEAQKNRGAKRRKGHHPANSYDVDRENWLTKVANPPFKLLIIWESEKSWKTKVAKFLQECMTEVANQ